MRRRKWIVNLVQASLAVIALWGESQFSLSSSPFRFALAFIVFLIIVSATDFLEELFKSDIMKGLSKIQNSCARDAIEITSIKNFLIETKEHELGADDEVHILTNSLENYDLRPEAIKVIAGNLFDNVKYIYYLPKEYIHTLIEQKNKLVRRLLTERSDLSMASIERNLKFYVVDEECLYNFAIVKSDEGVSGYWYITKPSTQGNSKEIDLVILTLRQDLRDLLLNVFHELTKKSKIISPFNKDLNKVSG